MKDDDCRMRVEVDCSVHQVSKGFHRCAAMKHVEMILDVDVKPLNLELNRLEKYW